MDVAKFQVGERVIRRIKPDESGMVTAVVFRESYVEYLVSFADNDHERTYQTVELRSVAESFSDA
jgi:hypothetical protein